MNPNRQKEKYDEILRNRSCTILNEEVASFRMLLAVKGRFSWEEKRAGEYHTIFLRGLIQ